MSDQQVALLAVGVWAGALFPIHVPLAAVFVVATSALVAFRHRWSWTFVLVVVLLASVLAGRAWAGIEPAVEQRFDGTVVLAADPQPVAGGIRVAAMIRGDRYDLRAWGSPAGGLRNRLMGERVQIEATLRPLRDAPTWLRAQGLSGRGTVNAVGGFDVGRPHTRLANSIRRTIESGASSMSRDEQALFAGLVYGDDRQQSALTADNFDAAGLTHLLAVSGQNVAFVLAIAGPVLRRLGHRQRFLFVLAVLILFATVTRFEPSVVRASVMTAVAAVAVLVGSEVSSGRVLSVAIAALVVVDPLIVHSVAFQLSVAASAGILVWSGRVARAVPGPRPLVEALAVTSCAQLAVAPLLVWRFDGLPVASLPANLLAGPAAGPVMMWGLTGGLGAGLVPPDVARWFHLPTRAALWWIDSVAAHVPRVPLGRLGAVHVALLFLIGWFGLRQAKRIGRGAAAVGLFLVLAHPAVVLATMAPESQMIDTASVIWRDDETTVLQIAERTAPDEVLSMLRKANVRDIDLVIFERASFANATLMGWVRSHHQVQVVWAPEQTMGVGELVPDHGTEVMVDGVVLTVDVDDDKLKIAAAIDD